MQLVQLSRIFRSSPLGAALVCALLGLSVKSIPAQTRLDSSQVTPLNGAATGPFAHTKLRDYNSVFDHLNGTANGIASAIQDCGATVSCSIIVPPSYGGTEAVPGYQLNYTAPSASAATSGNISIYDRRYSDSRMYVNYQGFLSGLDSTPSGWLYNYYSKASANVNLFSFYLRQYSLDGGTNQKAAALNYADKTSWSSVLSTEISHTPAQHLNIGFGGQTTSLGDYVTLKNKVYCNGGLTTEGDLGCRAQDNGIIQGNVEYSGTLTGSPAAAATTLTVSPTQGAFTQGSARFLAKLNAGTITAGTISQVISTYSSPVTINGIGTSWPVSTLIANLGTNVYTPGSVVVTPNAFSVGTMSVLQTTSLVCVADSESFEMVYPTAVTATTFTATFAKVHPNYTQIAVGGLCGYLMDLTADDVTNTTFSSKSQTITGTIHFAWPVIATTSATSASVWVTGGGGWAGLVTRWDASSANGYVCYPFAEVTSVQQSGGLSNTLTVSPNNVAWTAGDVVSEFIYPSVHYGYGNTLIESYYPNVGGTDGFSVTYNAPLQGNETMMSITGSLPSGFYRAHGGKYDSPSGVHLVGATSKTLAIDEAAQNASVGVGCVSPCNAFPAIIAASNGQYYDFLNYDQSNRRWFLSANNTSAHYVMSSYQFNTPFNNIFLANDGNSRGYFSTWQMRTNTVANTDLTGEVIFSNAATVMQPLNGTYSSHPECWARPQFDQGSTNRHWISYSSSSFTVNFAAPVSGTVSYGCAARN